MNKAQRVPYLGLTTVETPRGQTGLCHFCKYAIWWGTCSDGYLECAHPLSRLELWEPNDAWAGADCWGFRSAVSIDEAADMVGIWLNGQQLEVTP